MQALGLARDELVQAMGIPFVLVTTTLALSLSEHRLASANVVLVSILSLVPAALGLWIGRRVRDRFNEERVRKVFSQRHVCHWNYR